VGVQHDCASLTSPSLMPLLVKGTGGGRGGMLLDRHALAELGWMHVLIGL
jgi:hypothetical protein